MIPFEYKIQIKKAQVQVNDMSRLAKNRKNCAVLTRVRSSRNDETNAEGIEDFA